MDKLEVKYNDDIVGYVEKIDLETGIGTISILPEFSEEIKKLIDVPIMVSSRKFDFDMVGTIPPPTECHMEILENENIFPSEDDIYLK